jgi:hypothetical protein
MPFTATSREQNQTRFIWVLGIAIDCLLFEPRETWIKIKTELFSSFLLN